MNNLNFFERWMLKNILRKVIRQECRHKQNITALYEAIFQQARSTFYEDNRPTFNSFLDECYEAGKVEIIRPFKN
jgi:hypothetical protein